jgi:hypothetical protein
MLVQYLGVTAGTEPAIKCSRVLLDQREQWITINRGFFNSMVSLILYVQCI